MTDEYYMREALAQAQLTLEEDNLPVGAVVVSKGEILGKGRKLNTDFHLGHAEVNALRAALNGRQFTRDSELTIYTTLEPCIMCFGTILNCPVTKVVYAMEDVYGGATKISAAALPIRHHSKEVKIVPGVLREEARALFATFLSTTTESFWINPENPFIKSVLE